MAKVCNSLQNKAISTIQAWLFFVLDVLVLSLPSRSAHFIPFDSFMQTAHYSVFEVQAHAPDAQGSSLLFIQKIDSYIFIFKFITVLIEIPII